MQEFVIKEIKNTQMAAELEKIGFDKAYFLRAENKYKYSNIKIYDLTLPQANILKQTAISVGADCAVHREVITAKIDKTDCILGGSVSQIGKICEKLALQPFGLKRLAGKISESLNFSLPNMKISQREFDWKRPYLVGVLNLTKNSFSDGGEFYKIEDAERRALEIIKEGADIIELGAESTKPFSSAIESEAQLKMLLPIIKTLIQKGCEIPISVDTRSSIVAKECLLAGANLINDVSGFDYDSNLAGILAEFNTPVVIQHSKGTPEQMQNSPSYESLMDEIFLSLKSKIDWAVSRGIKRENIIVDAGIGFGKTREHNFEIIERIEELKSLNCPIMLGISRKSLLGLQNEDNETKDIFSVALNAQIIEKNVNFLRVHNVKLHRKLLEVLGKV